MRIRLRESPRRDGNVLPLINIVFLMLIFFLLAGTIAPTSDFDLTPATSEDATPATPPADAVYVSEEGFISVAGTEVTSEEIEPALASFAAILDGDPLKIVADHEADSTLILEIAETAKAIGIAKVRLVTLRAGQK